VKYPVQWILILMTTLALLQCSAFADGVCSGNNCPGAPVAGAQGNKFPMAILEGVLYATPDTIVAGDVVICEQPPALVTCYANFNQNGPTGSDVLHFLNNLTDTGQGQGTGNFAFEFTDPFALTDDPADVPFPFQLSANASAILENVNPNAERTVYMACNANGACNVYNVFSNTPEPGTFLLLSSGLLGLGGVRRWRSAAPRQH
jgi:hypothetical protein